MKKEIAIRWLTVLACLFALPFLTWVLMALLYLFTGINPNPKGVFNTLLLCLYAPVFFASLLLSHMARYLLFSVAGLVLALIALGLLVAHDRGQVWRRARFYLLIICAVSILTFPWFYPYQPAVVAAPGYEMRWPTQPGLLDGVIKRAQVSMEIRLCEYTALGWGAEGVLYYEEACKDRAPQVWAYNPDRDSRPRQVAIAPADLIQTTIPRSSVLEWVWSPGVRPADTEPEVRHIKVREHGVASPDNRWVAVVVRHIYGPEDLLVISGNGTF
ncbi:MAG: hypothetical protein ACETWR_10655 [Anaerolineae bacterium]